MYKFKMTTFENGEAEELIKFLNNFKKAIYGTDTTVVVKGINFLLIIICRELLREFEKLVIQNNGSTNADLKEIQEGLLK